MTELTQNDVIVMQAAARLYPAMLPVPADNPTRDFAIQKVPAEGQALIAELEAMAIDTASLIPESDGQELTYAGAIENAMMIEQDARAMTLPCLAAIDILDNTAPSWLLDTLRNGNRRLALWSETTTNQRAWIMDLNPRMIANVVHLPD